jgi:hypothetical protein
MNRQTHLLLQCALGSLNVFVTFPGLELPVVVSAAIHALLSGMTIALAVTAQNYNTDGTPQSTAFQKQVEKAEVKFGEKEDERNG